MNMVITKNLQSFSDMYKIHKPYGAVNEVLVAVSSNVGHVHRIQSRVLFYEIF